MRNKIKSLSYFLFVGILLLAFMFCMAMITTRLVHAEKMVTIDIRLKNNNQLSYEGSEFCAETVLVILNNQASMRYDIFNANESTIDVQFKTYGINDFSVGLSAVRCITPGISRMREQIRAEKNLFSGGTNKVDFMRMQDFRRILVLTLEESGRENVISALEELKKSPYVLTAHPNYFFQSLSEESYDSASSFDPEFPWGLEQIQAGQAQGITAGSSEIVVGVLDSGIQADHPDLTDIIDRSLTNCHLDTRDQVGPTGIRYDKFSDLSNSAHGTRVAGIISNNKGRTGVAKNVRLASQRVFGWRQIAGTTYKRFGAYADAVIKAIEYATQPDTFIPILNGSLGGEISCVPDLVLIREALMQYGNAGGLLVLGAGNDNYNLDDYPTNMASFLQMDNVIVVGASDQQDLRRGGTNYSATKVHVFAPGTALRTTNRDGGYVDNFGYTSGAAPHVTGVAALMLSANPNLSPAEIKAAILSSVDTPIMNGSNPLQELCVSGGRLNAFKALSSVAFALGEDGTAITGLNFDPIGELIIPEQINGKVITGIGANAFRHQSSLKDVTIPKSITDIAEGAFYGCSSLETVTFEDITQPIRIGSGAFRSCSSLITVALPAGLEEIPDRLFFGCGSLAELAIPQGVTSIGDYAFSGCGNLSRLLVPDGLTHIGAFAFDGCAELKSILLGEEITRIGSGAFRSCSSLITVALPAGLEEIPDRLFFGCGSLAELAIPQGVTSIGDYAFSGCGNLSRLLMPDGLTHIGAFAFDGCAELKSIHLGEEIARIGSGAFVDCGLQNIYIPASVTELGGFAFSGCSSLTTVDFDPNSSLTLIASGTFQSCESLQSIAVPSAVKEIGGEAFYACKSLTQVTLPYGLLRIGRSAFERCARLRTIMIPNPDASVDANAFRDSGIGSILNLTGAWANGIDGEVSTTQLTLTFGSTPAGIRTGDLAVSGAEKGTLSGSGLTRTLTISGITVGNGAAVTVSVVSAAGFAYLGENSQAVTVFVGETIRWTDLTANGESGVCTTTALTLWFDKDPTDRFHLGHIGVTGARKGALSGTGTTRILTVSSIVVGNGGIVTVSVTAPRGIELIEGSRTVAVAFVPEPTGGLSFFLTSNGRGYEVRGASAAVSGTVVIPASYNGLPVTGIADAAFRDCTELIGVTIPGSITSIGSYAFAGCGSLTGILFQPDSQLADIGSYAFADCAGLSGIDLPDRAGRIGAYAFTGCAGLISLSVPHPESVVNGSAFIGSGITTVMRWMDASCYGIRGFSGSMQLTLQFDQDPSGLRLSHITVSGASKEQLTGTGNSRTLTISGVQGGSVGISIAEIPAAAMIGSRREIFIDDFSPVSDETDVCLLVPNGSPRYVDIIYRLQALYDERGGLAIGAVHAQNDVQTQAYLIELLTNYGVGVIVVFQLLPDVLDGAIRRAQNAGVYVLEYDNVYTESVADCLIKLDYYLAGFAQAQYLIDTADASGGQPSRVEIFLKPQSYGYRFQSFFAGLSQTLDASGFAAECNVHILHSAYEAQSVIKGLFQRYGTLTAVVCFDAAFIPEATQAVRSRSYETVITALAYDRTYFDCIAEGMLDAAWYMCPETAAENILLLAEQLLGEESQETIWYLPFTKVDLENVGAFWA